MVDFTDGYTLSIIVFFALLAILIWRDRKHIEIHKLVIMRRTERFRHLLEWIAGLSPRFWRGVGNLAVIVAVGAMIYGTYFLFTTARDIVSGLITKPAVQFVGPSLGATSVSGPGYVLIPFWIWITIIALILIPHEMFHGIMARAEKIRLKSVGLLLLIIFPGAFVEPDEKQLQRAKLATRLRIFAIGSFANFMLALLALVIAWCVIWPSITPEQLTFNITAINASSPAEAAGMTVGALVTGINGHALKADYFEYISSRPFISDELGKLEVGTPVTFSTAGRDYTITPIANTETGKPFLGFVGQSEQVFAGDPALIAMVIPVLTLLWILSSGVGLVNILPLYPLDGGLYVEAVARRYWPKRSKAISRALTYLIIALLLFSFVGPTILKAVA
jgi:membrane-associated protease RseP (regulator of RpoE activity)